ncbi:MAG TPA: NADH-quinone oxidoreductase subunit NuoH [Gemmatimonadales bacterium]
MTPELRGFLLVTVIKLLLIFTATMVGVAYMTLMERWVSAWMQDRIGPNRVGPKGILQPVADGIKNLIKEETLPRHVNRVMFILAPALAFIPALLMSGVIPWAAPLPLRFDFSLGPLGRFAHDGLMPVQVADLPVGFLFILAIGSIGVYGIALAGWASNNKYSLLGGLRSSAQMVSYEIPMGMSLIPVLLLAGNVRFAEIIQAQQTGLWYVLPLFLSFFVFAVAGFAETNRAPFDLPEAESELVAGYHTEYSAFKFSMFFIAEYANVMTFNAMIATLFFGGWDLPFTHWDETPGLAQTLVTGLVMFLKVSFGIFVVMWVRWTLPRFRFDQLMAAGWKFLLPVALAYIMIMTVAIWAVDTLLPGQSVAMRQLVLFGLNLILAWITFILADRGFIMAGSYRTSGGVI